MAMVLRLLGRTLRKVGSIPFVPFICPGGYRHHYPNGRQFPPASWDWRNKLGSNGVLHIWDQKKNDTCQVVAVALGAQYSLFLKYKAKILVDVKRCIGLGKKYGRTQTFYDKCGRGYRFHDTYEAASVLQRFGIPILYNSAEDARKLGIPVVSAGHIHYVRVQFYVYRCGRDQRKWKTILLESITRQPTVIALRMLGYTFCNHKKGTYYNPSNGDIWHHAVIAMGYQKHEGETKIRIQNSYGKNWAEHGSGLVAITVVDPAYFIQMRVQGDEDGVLDGYVKLKGSRRK